MALYKHCKYRSFIILPVHVFTLLLLLYALLQFIRATPSTEITDVHKIRRNRDSSVRIATRLRDGPLEFSSWQGEEFFSVTESRPVLGPTQLPIQWVPGAVFLGVKWQEHGTDHSPPSNAEFKYV
jgi:hypothetical protein